MVDQWTLKQELKWLQASSQQSPVGADLREANTDQKEANND